MSLFDLLSNIGNKIKNNPVSNYANSIKTKATTLNPNPTLSELLLGQKIGTDDIDYSGLKGVDTSTPEYRESMGLSKDDPDPMVNISISNPQRYGGLFNDLTKGYKENRFNPISIDNFQDNDLEFGRKKGFAYRLGEGLGTLGRIAESPLGRGLITGAAIGMLGGNPAQVLTYGTVTGASNQSNRSKDALYRQQLAKEGIDTSNITGYINDDTYKSMLTAKQLRDNAEYRNALLTSQQEQNKIANQFRQDQIERQAQQDMFNNKIALQKLGLDSAKLQAYLKSLENKGKTQNSKTTNVINKNGAAIAKIDSLIDMLEKSKDKNDKSYGATGFWQGVQAESPYRAVTQNLNKNSTEEQIGLRSQLADLGSMVITDRSGTAQTANELKRLRPFIADAYDRPETAISKLKSMRNNILNETNYYLQSEGLAPEDFGISSNTDKVETTTSGNKPKRIY